MESYEDKKELMNYYIWSNEEVINLEKRVIALENTLKNNDEAINRILENHNQLFSKLLNRISESEHLIDSHNDALIRLTNRVFKLENILKSNGIVLKTGLNEID